MQPCVDGRCGYPPCCRAWNTSHPDKVQFVGTDVFDTRPSVYDEVSHYVQQVAPERLAELEGHFRVIRPTRSDWVAFFLTQVPDQQPYVDHARQAYQLVAGIPHAAGGRARRSRPCRSRCRPRRTASPSAHSATSTWRSTA